jgi:hypothetical protein
MASAMNKNRAHELSQEPSNEVEITIPDTSIHTIVKQQEVQRGLVRERSAGAVARIVALAFMGLLQIPLIGGLVAVLGTETQTRAYIMTVTALLGELKNDIPMLIGPVIVAVVGYYFGNYFLARAQKKG